VLIAFAENDGDFVRKDREKPNFTIR